GGCLKIWIPADKSIAGQPRNGVSRIGGQTGTQAPTLRPHHPKTGEAGPGALTHILPADSACVSGGPANWCASSQICLFWACVLRSARLTAGSCRRAEGGALMRLSA